MKFYNSVKNAKQDRLPSLQTRASHCKRGGVHSTLVHNMKIEKINTYTK